MAKGYSQGSSHRLTDAGKAARTLPRMCCTTMLTSLSSSKACSSLSIQEDTCGRLRSANLTSALPGGLQGMLLLASCGACAACHQACREHQLTDSQATDDVARPLHAVVRFSQGRGLII